MSHLVEKEKAERRETKREVQCMAATHSVPAHWGATCPAATNIPVEMISGGAGEAALLSL